MEYMKKNIQTILVIGIFLLSYLILNVQSESIISVKLSTAAEAKNVLKYSNGANGCQHPIYCNGTLLTTIQMNQVFNDSKTFVDMPMKYSIEFINEQFSTLMLNTSKAGGPNREELIEFLGNNFYPAGYEVEPVRPVDWIPNPSFLEKISNPQLKEFATSIHGKWLELTRVFNTSGLCDECHSSIPVTNPFVIAGSRFREFYYWDSYWIIHGLLVSNMTVTAKGMLTNFREIIQQYGFIPNGGRIYYLNRSQPPLFTQMVKIYYEATNDLEFLQETLPILEQEYQWWMNHRSTQLTNSLTGESVILNLYNASNTSPRPESYYEDYTDAEIFATQQEKDFFYSSIASAAESGWDFSSRWFSQSDITNLTTIQTIDVIPVDLNTILYMNEQTLSQFYDITGNQSMSTYYQAASIERAQAIQLVFWDPEYLQWFDYNLKSGSNNENFYPSNLLPLFADMQSEINLDTDEIDLLFKSLSNVLMGFIGGVPTSLINTNQQWDSSNAWPNLQFFIIESLVNVNSNVSNTMAQSLISRWVTTNYCGWNSTLETQGGMMFEKYNADNVGVPGGGGEYIVQDGFGWSNSVILYLFNKYSDFITLNPC